MKLTNIFSREKTTSKIMNMGRMFGSGKSSWLRESGIVDKEYMWRFDSLKDDIVAHNFNFELYHQCYERIPKVFRAINTRANFTIQGGYKLLGEDADVEKIKKWTDKVHFDNILIEMAKEMLLFGNVFIEPEGAGEKLTLKFLPVETIKVRRTKEGKHLGFVQIIDNKIVGEWKTDGLIHIKWNVVGTSPYGMSEIRPSLGVITDKLDAERVIPEIVKFHADNRIVWLLGPPDRPYNDNQMTEWKSKLQDRVVAGDVICGGDVKPEVIQPIRGASEIVRLLDHIESQVNTGLNVPQILITGRSDTAASLIQMDAFEREIMTQQDVLGKPIQNQIFTKIIGKEEAPRIIWNPMNIETRLRGARTFRQLVGDGKAPPIMKISEVREELGLPEDKEMDDYVINQQIEGDGEQDWGNKPGQGQRGEDEEVPEVRSKDKSPPQHD